MTSASISPPPQGIHFVTRSAFFHSRYLPQKRILAVSASAFAVIEFQRIKERFQQIGLAKAG
jgi:hypothetical protein